METGKIVIISATSGCGQMNLLNKLMDLPDFKFHMPRSTTSRKPRSGEVDGNPYDFCSPEEFRRKISRKEFVEYELVYEDIYYGTERKYIEQSDINILLGLEPKAALSVREQYADRTLTIFIKPVSLSWLRKKLKVRNTDDETTIRNRIESAEKIMEWANHFDEVFLFDGDWEVLTEKVNAAILNFLKSSCDFVLSSEGSGLDAICSIFQALKQHSKCKQGFGYGVSRYIYRGVSAVFGHKVLSGLDVRIRQSCLEHGQPGHPTNIHLLKELVEKARRDFPNKYSRQTDLEILADIQHNGGATCLIDFSKNILTALWFACQSDFEKNGQLYCYDIMPDIADNTLVHAEGMESWGIEELLDASLSSKTGTSKFYIWSPTAVNSRIIRQDSIFLFGIDTLFPKEDSVLIISIPFNMKRLIRKSLSDFFNISETTIYNDEVGFALANGKLKPISISNGTFEDCFRKAFEYMSVGSYSKAVELFRHGLAYQASENLAKEKKVDLYFSLGVSYKNLFLLGDRQSGYNALIEFWKVLRLFKEQYRILDSLQVKDTQTHYFLRICDETVDMCYRLDQYEDGISVCQEVCSLLEGLPEQSLKKTYQLMEIELYLLKIMHTSESRFDKMVVMLSDKLHGLTCNEQEKRMMTYFRQMLLFVSVFCIRVMKQGIMSWTKFV